MISFFTTLRRTVPLLAGFLLVPFVAAAQSSVTLQNPLSASTICGLLKSLLNAFLDIGIPVAVLFLVYAGFLFVLAQGNPDKLTKARQNLWYTLIGIGLFLGAWLLGQVVANTINAVAQNTGNAGGGPPIGSCR